MAYPALTVELALSSRPTETPVWVDVTDKVLAISTRRGRDNEFGPMQMGTAEVVLDNADRRFDPTYEGLLTNYISNPSFETGTGWWATAQGERVAYATTPVRMTVSATYTELVSPAIPCGGGETWTASFYVMLDETDVWTRYTQTVTTSVGATSIYYANRVTDTGYVSLNIYDNIATLYDAAQVGGITGYASIDCVQLEKASTATTYCDGAQENCKWAGEAHNSNSIRGGIYYGTLLPMRRLRVRGTTQWAGVPINYIDNPSAEATGWWILGAGASRALGNSFYGSWCYKLDMAMAGAASLLSPQIACTGDQTWTLSLYSSDPGTPTRTTRTFTTTHAATWVQVLIRDTGVDSLEWLIGDSVSGYFYQATIRSGIPGSAYVDAIQLEPGATATAYCDGDQPGCVWIGAPSASVSYRREAGGLVPISTYDVFWGYVDGWPQAWEDGVSSIVNLRACDGFKVLAKYELNETFAEELSDARLGNVLDAIGWQTGTAWVLDSSLLGTTTILAPYMDRSINTGNSTVMAHTVENANALQYMNDVVDSEWGMMFMGKDGGFVFLNRHYSYNTSSYATFGDAPGELGYVDYKLTFDDNTIWNDVRQQRIDGAGQTASDAGSQLNYFKRTLQNDRLLLTTDAAVSDRCAYLLGRYKDPHYRSPGLLVGGSEANWEQLLRREIGDRITVIRRPQGGTAINIQYRIEGIEHVIGERGQTWETRYLLSTADATSYWMVAGAPGDEWAAYAVLGQTTVLAY